MWRYAIGRGDDDPARAEFVSEAQARLRAESTAERRRQAARKATEALREKLRAAGIDPRAYYSMLAQRGNAARWRKQDAGPPASEAAARVTECAPATQASESAAAEVVVETRQAQAVGGGRPGDKSERHRGASAADRRCRRAGYRGRRGGRKHAAADWDAAGLPTVRPRPHFRGR